MMVSFLQYFSAFAFVCIFFVSSFLGVRLLKYAKDRSFVFLAHIIILFIGTFSLSIIPFLLFDAGEKYLYMIISATFIFGVVGSSVIQLIAKVTAKWLIKMRDK